MRTGKESSAIVEKTIKQINQLIKGVYDDEEKLEVIQNVCKQNDICHYHIIKVMDLKI